MLDRLQKGHSQKENSKLKGRTEVLIRHLVPRTNMKEQLRNMRDQLRSSNIYLSCKEKGERMEEMLDQYVKYNC